MVILDSLSSSHFRHSLLAISSSFWLHRWTRGAHSTSCCISRFTRIFTKVKLWADGWNYNQVTQIRRKPKIRNSNLCGPESCLKGWGHSALEMTNTWGVWAELCVLFYWATSQPSAHLWAKDTSYKKNYVKSSINCEDGQLHSCCRMSVVPYTHKWEQCGFITYHCMRSSAKAPVKSQ